MWLISYSDVLRHPIPMSWNTTLSARPRNWLWSAVLRSKSPSPPGSEGGLGTKSGTSRPSAAVWSRLPAAFMRTVCAPLHV